MIETVILAGLLATTGGLVLWLSHWLRHNVHISVRRPPVPVDAAKLDAEFDDISAALDLALFGKGNGNPHP